MSTHTLKAQLTCAGTKCQHLLPCSLPASNQSHAPAVMGDLPQWGWTSPVLPCIGVFPPGHRGTGEKRAEKEGHRCTPHTPVFTASSNQAALARPPQLPLPRGATAGPGPGMAAWAWSRPDWHRKREGLVTGQQNLTWGRADTACLGKWGPPLAAVRAAPAPAVEFTAIYQLFFFFLFATKSNLLSQLQHFILNPPFVYSQ